MGNKYARREIIREWTKIGTFALAATTMRYCPGCFCTHRYDREDLLWLHPHILYHVVEADLLLAADQRVGEAEVVMLAITAAPGVRWWRGTRV